jgi:steroid 5-alpha reductase family enzyme
MRSGLHRSAFRLGGPLLSETTEPAAHRGHARLLAVAVARDLPLLAVLAALVAEPSTRDFALANLLVQAALFTLGACLPAQRTGVMAFADIVWPWGLIAIGVQALLFGGGGAIVLVTAGIYLVMGLRMAAFGYLFFTNFPRDDLPRYRYRRLVWRREGYRSQTVPMQHEILQQGLCNASYLALPAMLAVADPGARVGPVVVAGVLLWAVSWVLESVADVQKGRFVRSARGGRTRTCDIGLWRYSRHPNYFFQWLQWHGLILVALPSLIRLADEIALLPWLGFAAGLLGISASFYYILVHYTGAIPAEHFSVQHRPDYRDYQRRVNRFFPAAPAR